jgi:hypothetical protein
MRPSIPIKPPPTRVAIDQDKPVAVEVWPSTVGTVIRVLLGVLAVLHATACVVFLYVVWSAYSALSSLQDSLSTWTGVGG